MTATGFDGAELEAVDQNVRVNRMQYSQAASGPWFDDSLPEPVPPANQCYPAYGVSEGPTNGDIVRAVSDLPSCLQPVYAGSFR